MRPASRPFGFVERDRLLQVMLQPYFAPLTTITAPTGYGKSTLATDFMSRASVTSCWVSLDTCDNALTTFSSRLIAAVRLGLDAGPSASSDLPEANDWLGELHQLLAVRPEGADPLCIVLDDYHVIENDDVHEAVNLLIENPPEGVHVLLLNRATSRIPLGRLRARDQVRELDARDLAFTYSETDAFLESHHRSELAPLDRPMLTDRTEGWIAGIHLAILSPESARNYAHQPLLADAVDSSHLDEYIFQEVINPLPANL